MIDLSNMASGVEGLARQHTRFVLNRGGGEKALGQIAAHHLRVRGGQSLP